ncbi:MAG: NifB/NifX family molybdenum-iron cluster-binding protein [Bacteroidales bacterium]
MKIAIPASTDKTDGMLDDRFGRCPYFCFYNTETGLIDFKENNHQNGAGGVGPQVSEFLAANGVNRVYAVEVGPKAKGVLDKLNILVQTISHGQTIKQIIDSINH